MWPGHVPICRFDKEERISHQRGQTYRSVEIGLTARDLTERNGTGYKVQRIIVVIVSIIRAIRIVVPTQQMIVEMNMSAKVVIGRL